MKARPLIKVKSSTSGGLTTSGALSAPTSNDSRPDRPWRWKQSGIGYRIVDEIEEAKMKPLLVNARKAKMMMCNTNKTDRLDVRGLNRLQRNGTLPTVWIPPMDLRDKRDLFRTRMYLVEQRTRLKNRVHAALASRKIRKKGRILKTMLDHGHPFRDDNGKGHTGTRH